MYDVGKFAGRMENERTARTYRVHLGYVERWLGKPLMDATATDLKGLVTMLRAKKSGRWYAAIARMFYRAASRETDNPKYADLADRLTWSRAAKASRLDPKELLSLDDVNNLLRVASSMRDRALIAVLWGTGARIHEILSVDLADVSEFDLPGKGSGHGYAIFFRKVKVRGEEHSGYVLEGASHLKAWIDQHPDPRPEAPLFVSWRGTRLAPSSVGPLLKSMAKRAGLGKNVYPHLFRHSRATHLQQLRVPEAATKKLMGWTPGSRMLDRYSHLTTRDARDALLRANGHDVPAESVDLGRLISSEAELRPVWPLNPPPGRPFSPVQTWTIPMADAERWLREEILMLQKGLAALRAEVRGIQG